MSQAVASTAFPAPEHDHDHCLKEAMDRARKAFEAKGLKLTPLRQAVFQEIAASHRAIGAYEVLNKLATRGDRLAPISVYRAIDALVAAGIVHRFESRNAFFACRGGHEMRQLVLACEVCGRVAEVDGDRVFAAIDRSVGMAAFSAKGAVVEVWGLCANCSDEGRSEAREPEHGRS
jgi:Fur family zinc uptake transcriptional regulator